eukprot:1890204-Rhodomonas_salina.3
MDVGEGVERFHPVHRLDLNWQPLPPAVRHPPDPRLASLFSFFLPLSLSFSLSLALCCSLARSLPPSAPPSRSLARSSGLACFLLRSSQRPTTRGCETSVLAGQGRGPRGGVAGMAQRRSRPRRLAERLQVRRVGQTRSLEMDCCQTRGLEMD